MVYVGGYHLLYSVYQFGLKNEMRTYLKQHSGSAYGEHLSFHLVKGMITDPSFTWEENKEEFRYKGEWYDVVMVHHSADSISITAIKDDRENNLARQVTEIHRTQHTNSGPAVSLLKFFSPFYIPAASCNIFLPLTQINYGVVTAMRFLPADREVHTPPPRC